MVGGIIPERFSKGSRVQAAGGLKRDGIYDAG
jgi:hypothetical protein